MILEQKYDQCGITVQTELGQNGSKITGILLDYTAETYLDLLNPDGEGLSACCADISRVRDIIYDTVRNNKFITPAQFFEAVDILDRHAGGELYATDDPLYKFFEINNQIDREDCEDCDPHISFKNPTNVKAALETIVWAGQKIVVSWMNSDLFDKDSNKIYHLSQLFPAIHTLYHKLKELDIGKQEIYVICNKEGEVIQTHGGCMFFKDEAKAINFAKDGEALMGKLQIKKATVSVEEGLVFEEQNRGN